MELFEPTYLNLEYLFSRVADFFGKLFGVTAGGGGIFAGDDVSFALKLLFFILCVFFLYVIFYSFVRMHELRQKEHAHMEHEFHRALGGGQGPHRYGEHLREKEGHREDVTGTLPEGVLHQAAPAPQNLPYEPHPEPETPEQARWKKIREYVRSPNVSDWKIAVMDADSMLDELLRSLKFPGDNLGDRLRNAAHSFATARGAGEAHGVRNRIAHDSGYELTHKEATKAIDLFEATFKEFNYI